MKILTALLLPLCLVFAPAVHARADQAEPAASAAQAPSEAELEAGRLLDLMDMDRTMQAGVEAMLNLQLQQNPKLAPYRQVMLDFFARYMSYASLRDEMVAIYAREFTAEELRAAHAFYSTPAGAKMLSLAGSLMQQGAELGDRRVREHLPELEAMIRAEQARLAEQQAEAAGNEAEAGGNSAD